MIEEDYIKTISEMRTQSTFSEFDFENTWEIKENRFPVLKGSNHVYLTDINVNDMEIEVGQEKTIELSFVPEIVDDAVLKYSITDEEIASVDDEGRVIGLKEGNTTIIIENFDGNVSKTVNLVVKERKTLTGIAITKAPDNINYIAGQNFDKTGMIVTATYDNGSTKEITNYTITDGNNLTAGKTSVTISYTENGVTKTTTQGITVIAKALTGIAVTKAPDNINYIAGQNFDKTGMIVTATYNDGTSKEVTNYTVTDGDNLTKGKTSVTISYTENGVTKTTTQSITVTEKLEISLETYEEKQDGTEKYIENIMQKTTVREILEKIKTNGQVEIYKGTTKVTDLNTNIATGMTLKIALNNESVQYTIVVTGDVNGDGKVSTTDITKIKKHIIQKESLEGCYKRAADVKEDEKISVTDLAKMKKVLVGLITF